MKDIDQSLIRGLLTGDEADYEAVLDMLYTPVYHYLLRLCRNSELAADTTQETFIAVWESVTTFKGKSKFTTWVFAIAYRQYLKMREKTPAETVSMDEQFEPADKKDEYRIVDENERLRSVLNDLPVIYRETVHLVYIQGFTFREAAEILQIPVGTLKSRINSALKMMRGQLNESEAVGDEAGILQI